MDVFQIKMAMEQAMEQPHKPRIGTAPGASNDRDPSGAYYLRRVGDGEVDIRQFNIEPGTGGTAKLKSCLEKSSSGSHAPTHSLAHRESRRNRQGYYIGRTTAKAARQANMRRGDSSVGSMGKGSSRAGEGNGVWLPRPIAKEGVSLVD